VRLRPRSPRFGELVLLVIGPQRAATCLRLPFSQRGLDDADDRHDHASANSPRGNVADDGSQVQTPVRSREHAHLVENLTTQTSAQNTGERIACAANSDLKPLSFSANRSIAMERSRWANDLRTPLPGGTTLVRSTSHSLVFLFLVSLLGGGWQAAFGQQAARPKDTPAPAAETTAAADKTPTDSDPEAAAVRAVSEAIVAAYNAGDAAKLAACFLPKAELVDDAGNVYRGLEEIATIFKEFREKFPKASMELAIDTIRLAGDRVAVEDGTRTVKTADATAVNKYTMVYVKQDGKWLVASARETAADPEPTPHDRLQPLAWLVGEWVNEDAAAAMSISCRWADNGNYLLADFIVKVEGEVVMDSNQRIGWDPHAERIRSWVFDSDGGYGEGRWAEVNGKWVLKSTATMPDGDAGSATIYIEPVSNDKFLMKGFDRLVGDSALPDFEATIVRNPPQPGKK
jgi:uncharacterized protein (TIGR02246 family)